MLSVDVSILLGLGMFLALYLRNTDDLVKKLYSKIDDLGEKLSLEGVERKKVSTNLDTLRAELWSLRLDVDKIS